MKTLTKKLLTILLAFSLVWTAFSPATESLMAEETQTESMVNEAGFCGMFWDSAHQALASDYQSLEIKAASWGWVDYSGIDVTSSDDLKKVTFCVVVTNKASGKVYGQVTIAGTDCSKLLMWSPWLPRSKQ